MQTAFEVLFLAAMIVPPAAVVLGMPILLGALMRGRQQHAGDDAVAHPAAVAHIG